MIIFSANGDRMKKAEMSSIIIHAYEQIHQKASLLKGRFIVSDIHDFRLEVKKLKAFLHLISMAKGGSKVGDLPRKLHQYYKALGQIRDLQLQKLVLKNEWKSRWGPQKKNYLDHIDQLIAQAMETATALPNGDKPFENGSIHLLATLPARLTSEEAGAFVTHCWTPLLQAGYPSQLDDEQLHHIRKALKNLQYTWEYLEGSLSYKGFVFSPEKIKSITNMLGDYLDKVVQLRLLTEDIAKANRHGQTQPFLQRLQAKWSGELPDARQKLDRYLEAQPPPWG